MTLFWVCEFLNKQVAVNVNVSTLRKLLSHIIDPNIIPIPIMAESDIK
jgi:hypothetical protein